MRQFVILSTFGLLCLAVRHARAADVYGGNDPYWALIHEPAIFDELKLGSTQRQALRKLTDELDLRFFPLRNKSREVVIDGMARIAAEVRQQLKTILQPDQNRRLSELAIQHLGYGALLTDDVAPKVHYTDAQRKRIQEITDETKAGVRALDKELNDGQPRDAVEKKLAALQANQQKKISELLKPDQRNTLKKLLGAPFDFSRIGQAYYKAPELVNTDEWINGSPMQLEKLRGKVVVVHFYAFGCINCIRNFPWYRQWDETFKGRDVALIGIHTPETAGERDSGNVRSKAADEKFGFPVLIDGKSENWNAWGNSMWPSVYLIDKRGYVRYFWPGELKWKGNDGEKYMRERIEQLLAEPAR
jgi:peroxiredoxin